MASTIFPVYGVVCPACTYLLPGLLTYACLLVVVFFGQFGFVNKKKKQLEMRWTFCWPQFSKWKSTWVQLHPIRSEFTQLLYTKRPAFFYCFVYSPFYLGQGCNGNYLGKTRNKVGIHTGWKASPLKSTIHTLITPTIKDGMFFWRWEENKEPRWNPDGCRCLKKC